MFKKFMAILLAVSTVILMSNPVAVGIAAASPKATLNISVVTKDAKNDLLTTLTANYSGVKHYATLDAALNSAKANGTKGIMVLADNYPNSPTTISDSQATQINNLGVRLYVEYPKNNAKLGITDYNLTDVMGYDRAIVKDSGATGLEKNSLLYVHGAEFVMKKNINNSWLVNATVAGYDTADFGLVDCDPYSLLEVNSSGTALIASTKLSQFITARYAPYERWQKLWLSIISWVSQTTVTDIEWTPSMHASYGKTESLSANAYKDAVNLNVQWYIKNMMAADGTPGIYQSFNSGNNFDVYGDQSLNKGIRADCNGESIGAIALAGSLLNNKEYKNLAYNTMKWMLNDSAMANGDRANPSSSQYGLLSWYNSGEQLEHYYGDDNAKAIIGLILGAAALDTDEFDQRILEAIIANFRTTGKYGFRGAMLNGSDLDSKGWESYFNGTTKNYASHFEALIWACYLWAYEQTDYEPLLIRTKTALTMMMDSYEKTMGEGYTFTSPSDKWHWTNSLQADRAKLILPLAWLVRIEPTEQHIGWLDRIITDMMAYQDKTTGAIREAIGEEGQGVGSCGPFTKNSEYGTHESPVIQNNGDPCTDSLYTSNFAMMTLNEAYAAVASVGNTALAEKYQKYAKSVSDYHVRIQQSSTNSKYNGAWFRGFDYEKWEVYGSDGDAGWGIWCTETGWTQAWISSALSLQAMKTNIWDYTQSSTVGNHFKKVQSIMLNFKDSDPYYQPDLSVYASTTGGTTGGTSGNTSSGSAGNSSHNSSGDAADEAVGSTIEGTDGEVIEIIEEIIVDDGSSDDKPSDKNGKLWLWIAIGAGAVVVIGAGVAVTLILLKKKKASKNDDDLEINSETSEDNDKNDNDSKDEDGDDKE